MIHHPFPWLLCLAIATPGATLVGCAAVANGGGGGGGWGSWCCPDASSPKPSAPSSAPSSAPQAGSVTARAIEQGATSHIDQDTEVVFRDAKAWAAFYAHHNGAMVPPAVDFASEQVVVVVLSRSTGGYALSLGPITTDGKTLTVAYTEVRPGPEAMTIEVLTQPYAFAAIPATSLPVVFKHLVTVRP